jgi:hypothetical protein
MVKIVNETKYEDGNYSALVNYGGFEFAIMFVAGEIRIYGTSVRRTPIYITKRYTPSLKKFFEKRVSSFGEDFLKRHSDLYETTIKFS